VLCSRRGVEVSYLTVRIFIITTINIDNLKCDLKSSVIIEVSHVNIRDYDLWHNGPHTLNNVECRDYKKICIFSSGFTVRIA